jgi:hypothetical protein
MTTAIKKSARATDQPDPDEQPTRPPMIARPARPNPLHELQGSQQQVEAAQDDMQRHDRRIRRKARIGVRAEVEGGRRSNADDHEQADDDLEWPG